jgi:SAM-dependent methyltransferase
MFTQRDRQKCQALFEKHYAGRVFFDERYRGLVQKYLFPGARLLDAGCGRALQFCRHFQAGHQVIGIDLDPVLETRNACTPFGVRGDLTNLPFPSEYFDLVISRSVVEHLESPLFVFREFYRVLRPGGKLVIVTPNKYDYVSIFAAVTPYWLHRFLLKGIFAAAAHDPFPTLYRANTARSLKKALKSVGLSEIELDTINHYPAYLMFSPLLFRLGMLYERFTSLQPFRILRSSIICVFERGCSSATQQASTHRATLLTDAKEPVL